jgi:hypothetical protein
MDGVRGVDFKLYGAIHVILAFNPKNYFDIIQSLGRGSRGYDKSCEGTLVIKNSEDKDVEPADIISYYKDQETENSN